MPRGVQTQGGLDRRVDERNAPRVWRQTRCRRRARRLLVHGAAGVLERTTPTALWRTLLPKPRQASDPSPALAHCSINRGGGHASTTALRHHGPPNCRVRRTEFRPAGFLPADAARGLGTAQEVASAPPAQSRTRISDARDPVLSGANATSHDPDRHMRRRRQGTRRRDHSAELESDDRWRLPEESRSRGRSTGRDRLRDVHAPSQRPCRLEHSIDERPLGANLSQRKVHHVSP